MHMENCYTLDPKNTIPFQNRTCDCIGTGHMSLALQQEYLDQLALVQKEIGFCYIRGHGLFCDDMAIYQEYTDGNGQRRVEYNFTRLDRVMDSYRRLGLKPFLELGFMPEKLASGTQTVFYYRGNVTKPRDAAAWCALVTATLAHLMARYGAEEVTTWPVEVWNEPNLEIFWEHADQAAYLNLFAVTYRAVKALDARFCVGGPAVCDIGCNEWVQAFLEFCRHENLRPDFISRHHYTAQAPVYQGHYGYVKLHDTDWAEKDLHATRILIDTFAEFRGLPLYLTEFNTSYIPRCPLHDTNKNAAFLAQMLSWLGDDCASYSYWTFGDVFEEEGEPFTPFHGGFGLVANGGIPKPTFWTFAFYRRLEGACVLRAEDALVVRTDAGQYRGIAWNYAPTGQEQAKQLRFVLPDEAAKQWSLVCRTVDEETANPRKVWHDLGEPANPSEEQNELLRRSAMPQITSEIVTAENGQASFTVTLGKNAVVYWEAAPRHFRPDRGYTYEAADLT